MGIREQVKKGDLSPIVALATIRARESRKLEPGEQPIRYSARIKAWLHRRAERAIRSRLHKPKKGTKPNVRTRT